MQQSSKIYCIFTGSKKFSAQKYHKIILTEFGLQIHTEKRRILLPDLQTSQGKDTFAIINAPHEPLFKFAPPITAPSKFEKEPNKLKQPTCSNSRKKSNLRRTQKKLENSNYQDE